MPDNEKKYLWARWLLLSVLVFTLDQLTKHMIAADFQLGESKAIFSWFNLVRAHNTGAAFSFLADAGGWQRGFFVVTTTLITGILLWMMRGNANNRWLLTAFALVIGGAFGNLYDRVTLGYVIDFVQWYIPNSSLPPWPAFNVADSSICAGAVMLVLDTLRKTKDENNDAEKGA